MMSRTIGRAMILVTMIRHTTTMIMRRIFENRILLFKYLLKARHMYFKSSPIPN